MVPRVSDLPLLTFVPNALNRNALPSTLPTKKRTVSTTNGAEKDPGLGLGRNTHDEIFSLAQLFSRDSSPRPNFL